MGHHECKHFWFQLILSRWFSYDLWYVSRLYSGILDSWCSLNIRDSFKPGAHCLLFDFQSWINHVSKIEFIVRCCIYIWDISCKRRYYCEMAARLLATTKYSFFWLFSNECQDTDTYHSFLVPLQPVCDQLSWQINPYPSEVLLFICSSWWFAVMQCNLPKAGKTLGFLVLVF